MKNKLTVLILILVLIFAVCLQSCDPTDDPIDPDPTPTVGWDGKSVTYSAKDIALFGSATPSGFAADNGDGTASVWNTDSSLDNYGGVQTPKLTLDFSKAVIFRMTVVSCHMQYIVKLAVEGESDYYYVLSDEGTAGEISVNVVDAMLCDKYRSKLTQPDPGYQSGWKYDGQKKNCIFHILAKGPDGERQTAELVLKDISVFNNETAVQDVQIFSDKVDNGVLTAQKGSQSVTLTSAVNPSSVTDKSVTWKSVDENVARVSGGGQVDFVGVGVTQVIATSKTDQSKSAQITVNVTSGYEDVSALKQALQGLTYNGSQVNAELFGDLFDTTWANASDMAADVSVGEYSAVDVRIAGNKVTLRSHYDKTSSANVNEANSLANGDGAYLKLTVSNAANAIVYRSINGKLYTEPYGGGINVQYLANTSGEWTKVSSNEKIILVFADGTVRKLSVTLAAVQKLADYSAADFANSSLWTVPNQEDLTQQAEIRMLSPASVRVDNGVAVIKQNKPAGAKYCFGGLVSGVFQAEEGKTLQIIIDVDSLNQKSEYVKTMWEVRIMYYDEYGYAVDPNPFKLDGGNVAGLQTAEFTPTHGKFVIYFVVNGSDIGEQFPDAEMKIRSMQIYALD